MLQAAPSSDVLSALVSGERWADMGSALQQLLDATDWSDAEARGRVVPHRGASVEYDAAQDAVKAAEGQLKVGARTKKRNGRGLVSWGEGGKRGCCRRGREVRIERAAREEGREMWGLG